MKILCTGGAGFGGSGLVHKLLAHKHEVTVLDIRAPLEADNLADVIYNQDLIYKWKAVHDIAPEDVLGHEVVVHLQAQADVPMGFSSPYWTAYENVMGTVALLEACRKVEIERLLYAGCHDDETRAVTPNGLKAFYELHEGDLVYSINAKTEMLEAKPIEKVIVAPYDGTMLRFRGKRFDFKVTPEHTVWYRTSRGHLHSKPAITFKDMAISYLPQCKWAGEDKPFIPTSDFFDQDSLHCTAHRIPEFLATKDLFYLTGLYIGDGSAYITEKEFAYAGSGHVQDKDTGRFLPFPKTMSKKTRYPKIFLHIPDTDKSYPKVETTLRELSIPFTGHKGRLHISAGALYGLFDQCGHKATEKRIPKWMLQYSSEYLLCLLQGLLDSDGNRNRVISTSSPLLVQDTVELIIKCGKWPVIGNRQPRKVRFPDGHISESKESFDIYISKSPRSLKRSNCHPEPYSGLTWCLQVKDNHNFLVERNGRFVFSGNSGNEIGRPLYIPIDEKHPLTPHNPYAFSKAAAEEACWAWHRCYGLPVVVMSNGIVTGPGMRKQIFLFIWLWNIAHGLPVELEGGDQTRDVTYVSDVIDAWTLAIYAPAELVVGQKFQVSYGEEHSVEELLQMCFEVTGKEVPVIKRPHRPGESGQRECFTNEKAKKVLGYKPAVPPKKAIELTWKWVQSLL